MIVFNDEKGLSLLNHVVNNKMKLRILDIWKNLNKIYTADRNPVLYGSTIKYCESPEELNTLLKTYTYEEDVQIKENYIEIMYMINDDYFHHIFMENNSDYLDILRSNQMID